MWILVIVAQTLIGIGVVGLFLKFSLWKGDFIAVAMIAAMYLVPMSFQVVLRELWSSRSGGVTCAIFSVIALLFVFLDLISKPFFLLSPIVGIICVVCTYSLFLLKVLWQKVR